MPCLFLKDDSGRVIHIKYGRGRSRRMRCKFCGNDYRQDEGKLCDFPVGEGRTCDAAMCATCAKTLGRQETAIGGGLKRMNDSIDVCPIHRQTAVVREGKLTT